MAHAVLGHRKRALEIARRLLKQAQQIDTGYDKREEALTNAARVFIIAGDTAGAIKCAAFVRDADRVIGDALRDWLARRSPHASQLQETKFFTDACRDSNTRRVRPDLIARTASHLAGAGLVDVARPLVIEALAGARLEGRPALYRTLKSMTGALSAVSPGGRLLEVARSVLDVESWWEHELDEDSDALTS